MYLFGGKKKQKKQTNVLQFSIKNVFFFLFQGKSNITKTF